MANIYLCAVCDGGGTLLRLKPSKWYACAGCVRKAGGKDQALLGVIDRLREMARLGDPRLQIPANAEAIMQLRGELLARLKAPAETMHGTISIDEAQ